MSEHLSPATSDVPKTRKSKKKKQHLDQPVSSRRPQLFACRTRYAYSPRSNQSHAKPAHVITLQEPRSAIISIFVASQLFGAHTLHDSIIAK